VEKSPDKSVTDFQLEGFTDAESFRQEAQRALDSALRPRENLVDFRPVRTL
jgi:hypothetical protein